MVDGSTYLKLWSHFEGLQPRTEVLSFWEARRRKIQDKPPHQNSFACLPNTSLHASEIRDCQEFDGPVTMNSFSFFLRSYISKTYQIPAIHPQINESRLHHSSIGHVISPFSSSPIGDTLHQLKATHVPGKTFFFQTFSHMLFTAKTKYRGRNHSTNWRPQQQQDLKNEWKTTVEDRPRLRKRGPRWVSRVFFHRWCCKTTYQMATVKLPYLRSTCAFTPKFWPWPASDASFKLRRLWLSGNPVNSMSWNDLVGTILAVPNVSPTATVKGSKRKGHKLQENVHIPTQSIGAITAHTGYLDLDIDFFYCEEDLGCYHCIWTGTFPDFSRNRSTKYFGPESLDPSALIESRVLLVQFST